MHIYFFILCAQQFGTHYENYISIFQKIKSFKCVYGKFVKYDTLLGMSIFQ